MSRRKQFVAAIGGNVLLLFLLVFLGNIRNYLFTQFVMFMLGFIVFNLLLLHHFKKHASPKGH